MFASQRRIDISSIPVVQDVILDHVGSGKGVRVVLPTPVQLAFSQLTAPKVYPMEFPQSLHRHQENSFG